MLSDRRLAGGAATDLDSARLSRFRHFKDEINNQKAVLDPRLGDLHVIGQVERQLEAAACNPTVQDLRIVLSGMFLASDLEHVLLLNNLDLLRGEPGQSNRDSILGLAGPLDVVRRPGG